MGREDNNSGESIDRGDNNKGDDRDNNNRDNNNKEGDHKGEES